MKPRSEGIRRLSLLAGILGAALAMVVFCSSFWDDYQRGLSIERRTKATVIEKYDDGTLLVENDSGRRAIWNPETNEIRALDASFDFAAFTWEFLGPSLLAVALGFLIPWGTIRVVGWVMLGFVIDWKGREE